MKVTDCQRLADSFLFCETQILIKCQQKVCWWQLSLQVWQHFGNRSTLSTYSTIKKGFVTIWGERKFSWTNLCMTNLLNQSRKSLSIKCQIIAIQVWAHYLIYPWQGVSQVYTASIQHIELIINFSSRPHVINNKNRYKPDAPEIHWCNF